MTGKQAFNAAKFVLEKMRFWIEACKKDSCCNEGAYLLTLYRVAKMLTGGGMKADEICLLIWRLSEADNSIWIGVISHAEYLADKAADKKS